ncbi:TadE/TadG family type IV pilus assembly protein [uncultured Sphingomonas sp.]|uniref:TadE/TadG family type IV pilus assembly protein n=1 Tax=uncultured Sphingomonas sp. TaxID=158754 RepID=UPI0026125382|nr:TadE/TadG family type IV pilus assembly protein [uncultured Sphingomonas sp.]
MASEAHQAKRVARGRRALRSLIRDRRGATILEFAAVAAPFIALVLAILQTALVFFSQQALETSAERTARQLITGAAQSGGMTPTAFKAAACANLPAFMKCANLMIDVQNASSFAAVNVSAPALTYDSNGNVTNTWGFSPGGAGSIVVMRTMYRLPVVGAPLGFNLSNMAGSQRLLIATSVFKTEPYGSGS